MKQKRTVKNVGASVRQRLSNLARGRDEDFNLILSRYAIERLLYRISQSQYADEFILKGAQLFSLWIGKPHRITRDLDLLRKGNPTISQLEAIFRSICKQSVAEPDGIEFLAETVRGDEIRGKENYHGVRIRLAYHLAGAKDTVQIDVGFGDAVTPAPKMVEFPSLLDFPAPRLKAYSREAMIAEKFQAKEWQAFLNKNRLQPAKTDLTGVVETIHKFLMPPILALANKQQFKQVWPPRGPWQNEAISSKILLEDKDAKGLAGSEESK